MHVQLVCEWVHHTQLASGEGGTCATAHTCTCTTVPELVSVGTFIPQEKHRNMLQDSTTGTMPFPHYR